MAIDDGIFRNKAEKKTDERMIWMRNITNNTTPEKEHPDKEIVEAIKEDAEFGKYIRGEMDAGDDAIEELRREAIGFEKYLRDDKKKC